MGLCSQLSIMHNILVTVLLSLGPALAQGPCCRIQVVNGHGGLDGTYTIKERPLAILEGVCVDDCIYSKVGGEPGDEYCFRKTSDPGSVECQADPPVTGEQPVTVEPSGEQPVTVEPSGEQPVTVEP